jgi:cell division protein FtsB
MAEPFIIHSIRFPKMLHKRLSEAAAANKPPASFQREIVQRLVDSFRQKATLESHAALAKIILEYDGDLRELRRKNEELEKQIAELRGKDQA